MKYFIRGLIAPFILGIVLIAHLGFVIRRTIHFIRYGGEFIQYDKDEKITIQDIYEKLKEKDNGK